MRTSRSKDNLTRILLISQPVRVLLRRAFMLIDPVLDIDYFLVLRVNTRCYTISDVVSDNFSI